MADCNDTLRELYEFLDGEVTPEDRARLKQHLDDCSPCLAAFDFEAELRMVVRQRCTEPVPDELRMKIVQALLDAGCQEAPRAAEASDA